MSDRSPQHIDLDHLPSLPWVYARLAGRHLRLRRLRQGASSVPRAEARVAGVCVEPEHLARYRRVCSLGAGPALPITYPQVLAAGLGASLMLTPGFELPALGVVHLASAFRERRAIGPAERLDFTCSVGDARERERGLELELVTRAEVQGEPVWDGVTTVLWRRPHPRGKPGPLPLAPVDEPRRRWVLPANTGRVYARASGDYNPIHLYALTARPFGFRLPIAQGLYLLARAIGELGEDAPPPPRRLEVTFERPVPMPGAADFVARDCPGGKALALFTPDGEKVHLTGRLVAGLENR